jgi:hypothetical protein
MAHCDAEALLVTAAAANIPALSGGMYLHGDAMAVTLVLMQQIWVGTDDAQAVLAAAAPNGFISRSEGDYLLILLALLRQINGGSLTAEALLQHAAECGFTERSEGVQAQITIELLRTMAASSDDAEVLLAAATTQQFTEPSRGDQLAIACQLLCEPLGGTCDAETLISEATQAGFSSVSKGDQISLINHYLCALSIAYMAASDFVDRSGITDAGQILAIQNLVVSLVDEDVWDNILAFYPLVGGTAATHAQNLKSSDYTITWNGTVTHNATGATSNGTTGYGVCTGLFSDMGPRGVMAAYSQTAYAAGTSRVFCGESPNIVSGPFFVLGWLNTGSIMRYLWGGLTNAQNGLVLDTRGFWAGSRESASVIKLYENGQPGTTGAITSQTDNPTLELFVLAANVNGTASLFTNGAFSTFVFGEEFDDDKIEALYTAVQAFQTALGRQI